MAYTLKIVEDVDTLRAVAHPLRMKLLGSLRADGPSTASELGRRFGESSGSTSYHLRQLERFGFVIEDEDQPSRRERRWKAAHELTSFRTAALFENEAGQELLHLAMRQVVDYLTGNLEAYATRDLSGTWRAALGASDYLLRLSADDVNELRAELGAVIERFHARESETTEAMSVALHVLALPRSDQ